MSLPGPVTCFAGVQAVLPGHLLRVQRGADGTARVQDRVWWDIDFPADDSGIEPGNQRRVEDEFEALLVRAVERRLRADVPVAVSLSGGVDSSLVAAIASRLRGEPVPAFSIQVDAPGLDERPWIEDSARSLDIAPIIQRCGRDELMSALPAAILCRNTISSCHSRTTTL